MKIYLKKRSSLAYFSHFIDHASNRNKSALANYKLLFDYVKLIRDLFLMIMR